MQAIPLIFLIGRSSCLRCLQAWRKREVDLHSRRSLFDGLFSQMSPHAAHSFLHYDGFAIAAPEDVSCYALRIMRSAKYVTTSETGPNYAPRIYLEPQDGHAA